MNALSGWMNRFWKDRNRGRALASAVSMAILMLSAFPAEAWEGRQYGGNFGWSYSTPRTTYYNGPAIGLVSPYGPSPYYGYGRGGNVQYFRRGRSGFAVETYRDRDGRLRQRTGVFFYGGR